MRAYVGLALLSAAVVSQGACSSKSSSKETGDGGNGNTPPYDIGPDGGVLPPLAQVAITEVAAFQGTKAQIVTTTPIGPLPITPQTLGQPPSHNAPVVALRTGQIRLYIDPTNGGTTSWTPHVLTGELDVFDSNGNPLVPPMGNPTHLDEKMITGPSTDGDLSSTFNFLMEPQDLPEGAQFTVTVRDKSAAAGSDVNGGAIYPTPGMGPNGANYDDMNVQSSGQVGFQYQVVPLTYNPDGSGRLPDLTDATMSGMAQGLTQVYPVDQVTYTIHAPYPWSGSDPNEGVIDPNDINGFANILMQMSVLHESDHAAENVWYVASVAPADSFDDYCVNGCILGVANVQAGPQNRVCAIAGYGLYAASTMYQELAHTIGELHAPCPYPNTEGAPANGTFETAWPSGITPGGPLETAFPTYANARIGQWGYDIFTRTLLDPNDPADPTGTKYREYMSYCGTPTYTVWTSDYSFNKLFKALKAANAAVSAKVIAGPANEPKAYHYVVVSPQGTLRWGLPITFQRDPEGATYEVSYIAADGHIMAHGPATFGPFDGGGGLMLVPEGPAGFSALRIEGMDNLVTNILPAKVAK